MTAVRSLQRRFRPQSFSGLANFLDNYGGSAAAHRSFRQRHVLSVAVPPVVLFSRIGGAPRSP